MTGLDGAYPRVRVRQLEVGWSGNKKVDKKKRERGGCRIALILFVKNKNTNTVTRMTSLFNIHFQRRRNNGGGRWITKNCLFPLYSTHRGIIKVCWLVSRQPGANIRVSTYLQQGWRASTRRAVNYHQRSLATDPFFTPCTNVISLAWSRGLSLRR